MSDVTVTVRSDQLPSTTTVTVRQNQISSVEVIPCQSFRFLDLPAELRVQVYEEVVVVGKVFYTPERIEAQNERRFKDWKLYRKPQLQLLRVCKTIHQEAEKVYLSKNLFVLPAKFETQAPFVLKWSRTYRPSEYRWLFSKSAYKEVKNISFGFSPVLKIRHTSSYIDFDKQDTDKTPSAIWHRSRTANDRKISAHDKALWDFHCHCSDITDTLGEGTLEELTDNFQYMEMEFTNSYCPLGCCRYIDAGYGLVDSLRPKHTVILGLDLDGEKQVFMNLFSSIHSDDEGQDEDWGTPEWITNEYGVEFNPDRDIWAKWKMEA
jgi:hypothetical protein